MWEETLEKCENRRRGEEEACVNRRRNDWREKMKAESRERKPILCLKWREELLSEEKKIQCVKHLSINIWEETEEEKLTHSINVEENIIYSESGRENEVFRRREENVWLNEISNNEWCRRNDWNENENNKIPAHAAKRKLSWKVASLETWEKEEKKRMKRRRNGKYGRKYFSEGRRQSAISTFSW